jgi:hypothetical protein
MKRIEVLKASMKAFFSPAGNDLKRIQDDLIYLEKEMIEISKMENKVLGIIRLFKVISPIQDKGGFSQTIGKLQEKNVGDLDQIISALKVLQIHFERAGRCDSGINRTKVGEEITAEKVFLGDIYGIWTKTASYWLTNQEKCKQDKHYDASKDKDNPISIWYLINDYQAGGFVKSHTDGILAQIAILKKAA